MAKRHPLRWILITCGVILLPFVLFIVPELQTLLDILLTVIFGSGWFMARVVPHIQVRWELVASTLVYAFALIIGSHFFLRWLYREMSARNAPAGCPATRPWQFALTLRGCVIALLMFLVGMAAIGVAHQTAWFMIGPEPSFTLPFERYHRAACAANLIQIHFAMTTYANQHGGRYPDDFRTLISETLYPPDILICHASSDTRAEGSTPEEMLKALADPHHCSYLYFGKGLTTSAPAQTILVAEPLENHQRGINVLHADRSVEWLDRAEAVKLLARLQQSTPATQPATRP